MNWLRAQAWKIATGIAAAATIFALIALALSYVENRHLQKQNVQLDKRINDPVSGYIRKLAQANTNTEQLKTAIDSQRVKFEAKARADAATLAETTRRLAVAHAATHDAQIVARKILATAPRGSTLEDRVRDIDARLMETLQ